MVMMNPRPAPLWRIFAAIAITVAMIRSAGLPALAEDVGANRSELIHSLLPTVVNISVRKVEPVAPAVTDTVSAAKPRTSGATTVKGYVGSGFVIDPSGLIVTNYHVVENAFEITVMFSDGSRLPGKVMSGSRLADLALVKVAPAHSLAAAHWGDSDELQVGDQVFAAGNPFGLGLSISAGVVSGLNRNIQDSPYDDFIQTDATINHGNSGGPLFDMQGNVIGVDSSIISPTAGSVGLGFAIPANNARFVIGRLQTYGWIRPGWIGVKLQQVTPEIAEAMGMTRPEGSLVAWVMADGPGQMAGLAIGDVVLRFNGHIPSDERALLRSIAMTPVGDSVTLEVRHDQAERTLTIATKEWPRDQWDARDAPTKTGQPKTVIPPDLGLSLAGLAAAQKAKLGLDKTVDGVLVTAVAPESDPVRRGMVNGDIILRVQDTIVAAPADVRSAVNAARAAKLNFVMMLVLPKERTVPGPKWIALQLGNQGG
jgi:serine protease Do